MFKSPYMGLLLAAVVAALFYLSPVKLHDSTPLAGKVTEIHFYDKNDTKITLDRFKGKVVVANLWATWCPPCVSELASLSRLQEKLGRKNLAVVAIAVEKNYSVAELRQFLDENGAKGLEVYLDKDQQFPLKWKYKGIPVTFLIDKNGNLVEQYLGPYAWDQPPQLDAVRAVR